MRETKQPPNRDINLLNQKGAPETRSAFDLFFLYGRLKVLTRKTAI